MHPSESERQARNAAEYRPSTATFLGAVLTTFFLAGAFGFYFTRMFEPFRGIVIGAAAGSVMLVMAWIHALGYAKGWYRAPPPDARPSRRDPPFRIHRLPAHMGVPIAGGFAALAGATLGMLAVPYLAAYV